jgi:hypothetical protein
MDVRAFLLFLDCSYNSKKQVSPKETYVFKSLCAAE